MNILIVAEKPSVSKSIAPIARKHWPADQITFVHANPYGNLKFKYPRGLSLTDFPQVSEPADAILPWAEWHAQPILMAADGQLSLGVMSGDLFAGADLIICACDPDHTGANGFRVIMQQVFGDDRFMDCPAMTMFALDDKSVQKAIANLRPFKEAAAEALHYGRMKRFFDWNWNVNSLAVLGAAMRRAGVSADAPPMSKYALQLLYRIRDQEAVSEMDLCHEMHRWQGTGRYQPTVRDWRQALGSMVSQVPIIENLRSAGLIHAVRPTTPDAAWTASTTCSPRPTGGPRRVIEITPLGRAFLAALHPGCLDPDLPFRLHAWCEQGEAAKPAMTRYLNTFFSRQLRFRPKA